ncbi:serpin A12 [Meriones unguiculatus]|uniref:serpin A12 n=1 Tax=Meriones unguiculatus TaxID=10047 RepID=UPI000B4F06BB|nr:serpin A12 [Meriones unguiculatus]XP_021482488.1 serpin A12 [Meriones unguiculatus]XP_060244087.1 serpin A12 [Meriones unguiculatus]XP_060244088.1 serpin A12 [Meriones unguiculatus]XP_060244089.1 serpin A12 [Meriones unguiculatus]XP_060244090.1 serpin A12 [Meriones unguiculatus]XP_060244091.1 serpin A12 [Meriones unguiculatus]XP_060244092.1 serpin A12 [Meriones unguiculatus]XP_060244093.1 serpin A12 [Meriones unguiculatus]XP_060244094.1 serpin A12 [Meriones unguiculatus]
MNLMMGLGLFLAGLLSVNGLLQAGDAPDMYKSPVKVQEWRGKKDALVLAQRNMQFGFKLLRKLASIAPRQNIFFSPLSISIAFSMLSLGSQNSTLEEIKEGFNFKGMPDRDMHTGFYYLLQKFNQETQDIKMNLGNALFMDQKLRPRRKFLRLAKTVYDADMMQTNFQDLENAQREINKYVSQKTHNRINNLVRSIDPGTVMLLANYIYFRARWQYEFNPKETKEGQFFVEEGKSVKVPMMFHEGIYDMAYDSQLSCTILELPYRGNITATFVLPDSGKMKQLEQALKTDIFAKWKSLLSKRVIKVWVPRLHISATYNLKKVLSRLGISKIFEEHGDLTRISSHRSLKVGEAIHKAELKMDEKGAEGAAGSGAQTLPMETPVDMKLNKPFLIMIYEESTPSMIFLARISDPSGK